MNKIIIAVLAVILICVLGYGGYYAYTHYITKTTTTSGGTTGTGTVPPPTSTGPAVLPNAPATPPASCDTDLCNLWMQNQITYFNSFDSANSGSTMCNNCNSRKFKVNVVSDPFGNQSFWSTYTIDVGSGAAGCTVTGLGNLPDGSLSDCYQQIHY
jgi:hypothetical protein